MPVASGSTPAGRIRGPLRVQILASSLSTHGSGETLLMTWVLRNPALWRVLRQRGAPHKKEELTC